MPKFIKRNVGSGRVVGGRRFVVRARTAVSPKKVRSRSRTAESIKLKADSTIDSLNMLLEEDALAKQKLAQTEPEGNAVFEEDPEMFDGISDAKEARDLYDRALSYERSKSQSVEERIRAIQEENEREKRQLEAQIRELKRELHRTAPLHDTKFFSLTKELKTAIEDLERVMATSGTVAARTVTPPREVPVSAEAFVAPAQPTVAAPKVVVQSVEQPVAKTVVSPAAATPASLQENDGNEKKGLAKNKMLVTGVSAVVLLFVMSGVAGIFLSKPKVDEKIVAQYLPGGGQVQGAQTTAGGPSPTPQAVDPSQQDVNFEQAVWEDYKDMAFGIMLQYPKNAVKVIRTDSNVTFIRKTGYLFKVQRIETSYTVDDYWKQIKSTSLNYSASSEKFKGNVALKLTLEDMTDYPGDRYLVKMGGFIYDVWYATPSNNFTSDDIKLAEKMLASLSIVGSEEQ